MVSVHTYFYLKNWKGVNLNWIITIITISKEKNIGTSLSVFICDNSVWNLVWKDSFINAHKISSLLEDGQKDRISPDGLKANDQRIFDYQSCYDHCEIKTRH